MSDRRKGDPEELAARLLRDPNRASADDIVDAIREVNPSRRDLPRAVQRRRYDLKSALQSLLIRRFGDDIEITRDPEREGVVLLRHRYADHGEAAHSVVDELDVDARSIVQRRLDAEEEDDAPIASSAAPQGRATPGRSTSRVSGDDDTDDLVARGDAAREIYEYETARQLYEDALAQSGGALYAALPLVELLVDYMAADAAALAMTSRFAPAAIGDVSLRSKLALAAARIGDREQVERWLEGVPDDAAADAWIALTDRAITDGRADDAATFAKIASDVGAAAAEVIRHKTEIAALQRAQWSEADAALENVIATGDIAAAEAGAAALLVHWPEAQVARRVMVQAKERRRAAERDRLLTQAQEALSRGDMATAEARSASARALGADTSAIDDAIAAAVEAARRKRDDERVEQVVNRLANTNSREALHEYLDLAPELRVAVRRVARRDVLTWLDHFGNLSGARAAATVTAVMAFESLVSDDPEAVLAKLTPHEEVLQKLPIARDRLAKARTAIAARRRAAAEEQITAAINALDADDLDRAKELLALVDNGALDNAGRERLHATQERLDHAHELVHRIAAVNARIASSDFLGAESAIAWLCEIADEQERARWQTRAGELAESARQQWPVYDLAVAGMPIEELAHVGAEIARESQTPTVWYVLDGEEVVLASSLSRWLFVYSIEVSTRSLRRALVIPLPARLGKREVTAFKRHVWVVGTDMIEVDLDARRVCASRDLHEVLFDELIITATHVLPDAGYIWGRIANSQAIVVDLKSWVRQRETKVGYSIARLLGGRDPQVASFNADGSLDVHEAGGMRRERVEIPDYQIHALCQHPAGVGRRVAVVSRMTADQNDPRPLWITEIGLHGRRRVAGADGMRPHVLLTLPAARVALVLFSDERGETRIEAFDTSGEFTPLWSAEAPHQLIVAEDIHGRRAVAVYPTETGLDLDELGGQPPTFRRGTSTTGRFPQLAHPFGCKGVAIDLAAAQAANLDWNPSMKALIEMLYAGNVDTICALISDPNVPVDLVGAFDRDLFAELQKAEADARAEAWQRVVERLEGLAIPIPAPRPHRLHLLGTARLRLGDHAGALLAFHEARRIGGDGCRISGCIEWVEALIKPLDAQDENDNPSQRMLRALRAADASFANGDLDGVRRALERPVILAANEGQSLARLAAAHLAGAPPSDDIGRAKKAEALARFCAWSDHGVFPQSRTEVFLLAATWDAARLAAVHEEAKGWLDANFPPGKPPR